MKQEEINTNDYLKGIVLNLPESPGIYQYLNAEGTIIYVGKAKNLKRRALPISIGSIRMARHECSSAR